MNQIETLHYPSQTVLNRPWGMTFQDRNPISPLNAQPYPQYPVSNQDNNLPMPGESCRNALGTMQQMIETIVSTFQQTLDKILESVAALYASQAGTTSLPAGASVPQAMLSTENSLAGGSASDPKLAASSGNSHIDSIIKGLDRLIDWGGGIAKLFEEAGSFLSVVKDAFSKLIEKGGGILGKMDPFRPLEGLAQKGGTLLEKIL